MSRLILVTGGARSGKSRLAEDLAVQAGLPVTYLATAQIRDEEMARRVAKHRSARPTHWSLIEEPYEPARALRSLAEARESVVLMDCVTLWLSNLLLRLWPGEEVIGRDTLPPNFQARAEAEILPKVEELAGIARELPAGFICVTNEVGQGIVPDQPLSRLYRDLAGQSNQILAQAADGVYLVVAGYPLEIKRSGTTLLSRPKARE
ncbi:bifunctional adenosylcobalamin biosynthesis protein CobU [Peptococcaceae bacterium CEB3]|nr:bifunctional adenosylcobalamin biosynthesis protein CobU [Peptococcaceae bacterium CEB3]